MGATKSTTINLILLIELVSSLHNFKADMTTLDLKKIFSHNYEKGLCYIHIYTQIVLVQEGVRVYNISWGYNYQLKLLDFN